MVPRDQKVVPRDQTHRVVTRARDFSSLFKTHAALICKHDHARPFVGVFKSSCSRDVINFWQYMPTNWPQIGAERGWDNPTKGLLWHQGEFGGTRSDLS